MRVLGEGLSDKFPVLSVPVGANVGCEINEVPTHSVVQSDALRSEIKRNGHNFSLDHPCYIEMGDIKGKFDLDEKGTDIADTFHFLKGAVHGCTANSDDNIEQGSLVITCEVSVVLEAVYPGWWLLYTWMIQAQLLLYWNLNLVQVSEELEVLNPPGKKLIMVLPYADTASKYALEVV